MARHVRVSPAGAGQLSYDVTSEAAMTGENLALLNQGTFCVTLDTSAVYEAYPTGTTPPAGAITIAATNGVWVLASSTGGAPGTPAYNPTWYAAANIYVDPANSTGLASDANAGTSAITPLLTFGQIVQRWGSSSPQLAVSTTIHQMSSQGAGDPVILSPIMSAGTNFALVGTTVAAGAPFSPGSVTPKVRGNPGTLLQLTAMPAGSAAGQLVHNVTKDSYAFIDSMAAAVATMTQPLAASGLFTIGPTQVYAEDDTWAAGDTYQRLTLPTTNLKIFDVSGGDSTAGYTAPIGWLQTVHVVDVSGVGGNSVFAPRLVDGNNMTISSCQIDPQLYFDCSDGPYSGFVAGSWVPNGSYLRAAIMMGGAANTTLNANGILLEDLASVDGDAILHGPVVIKGGRYCIFGLAYADASIVMAHGGGVLIEPDILATGHLWGATTINLEGTNSSVINGSGGTWATCLTVGQLSLEGANTGSAYSLGTYVDGIALTSANLDSYNGLSNPITGSRFASLSTPTSTGGGLVLSGLTTAAMTGGAGQSGYMSANNVATPTDNLTLAKSRFVGIYTGISGELQTDGVAKAVQLTTVGGSPAANAPLWLAASTDDGATGVGKWTATAPTVAGTVVAEVGICLDNTNYAGAKTVKALIQVKPPVQL